MLIYYSSSSSSLLLLLLLSSLLLLHIVVNIYYSGVSIVDFEQANVSWEPTKNPTTATRLRPLANFFRKNLPRKTKKQDFTFLVTLYIYSLQTAIQKNNSTKVNFKDKKNIHDDESLLRDNKSSAAIPVINVKGQQIKHRHTCYRP